MLEDTIYRVSRITSLSTIPLTILVCVIYVLRVVGKNKKKTHWVNRLNRKLRKAHIPMGWLLMVVSLIHGICASTSLFSLNWGTVCFAILLLLGLSFMLRKRLKNWMFWHRVLTVVFLLTLAAHLVEVDGHESRRENNVISADYSANQY